MTRYKKASDAVIEFYKKTPQKKVLAKLRQAAPYIFTPEATQPAETPKTERRTLIELPLNDAQKLNTAIAKVNRTIKHGAVVEGLKLNGDKIEVRLDKSKYVAPTPAKPAVLGAKPGVGAVYTKTRPRRGGRF